MRSKRKDIIKDLSDSAQNFKDIVWPAVNEWLGGGELIPVESVTNNSFTNLLDILAGIDAWQVKNDLGIRGIASRIQWGAHYESFTIRKKRTTGAKTELDKRLKVLTRAGDWLFPYWTIQAYITKRKDGELLYACATKTKDLFRYIYTKIKNKQNIPTRINPDDENEFYVIWINELLKENIMVHFHKDTTNQYKFLNSKKNKNQISLFR